QEIGDRSGEGTTLNNISQIHDARGEYDQALSYLTQSLAIRKEIGDTSGLCVTLFNIGHIRLRHKRDARGAFEAWLEAYRIASKIQLAQVLEALEDLAPQLGLEGGLDGWAMLDKAVAEHGIEAVIKLPDSDE
ncbi:MAG: tetratricopeptide repeat protein, partial [Pontibacterium sp.]